jgi:hypothetical protein
VTDRGFSAEVSQTKEEETMDKQIKLEIEELEERIAPATLTVSPRGAGTPGGPVGNFPLSVDGAAPAGHPGPSGNSVVSIG